MPNYTPRKIEEFEETVGMQVLKDIEEFEKSVGEYPGEMDIEEMISERGSNFLRTALEEQKAEVVRMVEGKRIDYITKMNKEEKETMRVVYSAKADAATDFLVDLSALSPQPKERLTTLQ